MPAATVPIPVGPDPVSQVIGGLLGAGQQAASLTGVDSVVRAGMWVSDWRNWLRVSYVVTGGMLVMVGVAFVIFDSGKVKQVAVSTVNRGSSAYGKAAKTAIKAAVA